MKFEKVNNDKMRVTLSRDDLKANDIDLHSFMSDSSETESLFLAVLNKAEQDYGFSTANYRLKVETFAMDDGNFILTITRSPTDISEETNSSVFQRKKFRISRKTPSKSSECLVYKFDTFDDFCGFSRQLYNSHILDADKIAKSSMLYSYNNSYYWALNNINSNYPYSKRICSSITEFGTYVSSLKSFIAKLHESGTLIIKSKAIKICSKYFIWLQIKLFI